jgi:hypothetical protein
MAQPEYPDSLSFDELDSLSFDAFIDYLARTSTTHEQLMKCLARYFDNEGRRTAILVELIKRPLTEVWRASDKIHESSDKIYKSSERLENFTWWLMILTIGGVNNISEKTIANVLHA